MHVVAALICREGKLLSVCRGYGKFKGFWEFPGGKIEQGESLTEALRREIKEELAADIQIEKHLLTHYHSYDEIKIVIECFSCTLEGGFSLLEHSDCAWLGKDELFSVEWLEADVDILTTIVKNNLLDFS